MDLTTDQTNTFHSSALRTPDDNDSVVNRRHTASLNRMSPEGAIVRSVAMSTNIAETVRDEVNHFIHVNSFGPGQVVVHDAPANTEAECKKTKRLKTEELTIYNADYILSSLAIDSCCHILPPMEDNIVLAILLSKWDDIMGPQTIHVWLRECNVLNAQVLTENPRRPVDQKTSSISVSNKGRSTVHLLSGENTENSQSFCRHVDDDELVLKAVKYVTSHTVNYTGLSLCGSSNEVPSSENSVLFVVPELDLVSQSVVFELHENNVTVPYSLSVMVSHCHYQHYMQFVEFCEQWLQRMCARIGALLLNMEHVLTVHDKIGNWMIALCSMITSLKLSGISTLNADCDKAVLSHPLLRRALTSHLQTFGCTIVMGTSVENVNTFIAFLALFLDSDERLRSRMVFPSEKYCFQYGLFVQGLLLDEFGCRELCSTELSDSPFPVTAVDLQQSGHPTGVRQMCALPHADWSTSPSHESILRPVKESAPLVHSLVDDLNLLPLCHWKTLIGLFKAKVKSLAHHLLSLLSSATIGDGNSSVIRYLCQAMDLQESDVFIVLAYADKLKPGIHSYVMTMSGDSR